MSYKSRLSDLSREGESSLTQQIVDAITEAISSGELGPGEKLPPTRELAELAGVNHLTAVRAYRRLRELGLITAHVGRGTFVREPAPALVEAGEPADGDRAGWQRYALPERAETYGDRVIEEMFSHSQARGLVPLSVGYPAAELYPVGEMSRAIERVLAREGPRALQYADIPGVPELIEELARLSASRGSPEEPRNIIVAQGARQGLTLAARAVLRPGDVAAVEAPSFWGVMDSLRTAGARLLAVPVDADGLDADSLEALLSRHEIRVLALQPRAQNPTGRDLSPERRRRVVELARRHGFFIIEDGIYGDLAFDREPLPPLRAEAPEHVIYVDSLSKVVGGGLRAGWVAASGPVRDRILAEKQRDDLHSTTLPQLAVASYLAEGGYQSHLERAREFHRERRDALLEALDRHLGGLASFVEPAGGAHVWVTLERGIDESELASEAVRNGVTFVPGAAMLPERPLRTMLRLSFCFVGPAELEEGCRRLGRALRSLVRRPRAERALPIA
jgi:2-aminoadipate transaminase